MLFALTVTLAQLIEPAATHVSEPPWKDASAPEPVRVKTGVRVRDVALGPRMCVLTDEGLVRCGTMVTPFEDVPLPEPATAVTAGLGGTCAQLAGGGTACWDCMAAGSPSEAPPNKRTGPLVLPFPKLKNVTVGWTVACGVLQDGSVRCWGELPWSRGENSQGAFICDPLAFKKLPKFSTTELLRRSVPATRVALPRDAGSFKPLPEVTGDPFEEYERKHHGPLPFIPDINVVNKESPEFWARVDASMKVWARGSPARDRAWVLGVDGRLRRKGVTTPKLSHVIDVQLAGTPEDEEGRRGVVRPARGCALLANGRVVCWGNDGFGQSPLMTRFPRPAKQLTVGSDHTCALLADQRVFCWGANPRGALGFASETGCPGGCRYELCAADPAPVFGLEHVTRVVAGPESPPFTCAVTQDGGLACWGHGYGLELPGPPVGRPIHMGAPQCEPEERGL
jgi:hypothetical protein